MQRTKTEYLTHTWNPIMGDLYHENICTSFHHEIFEIMNKSLQHQFVILTKRPARLLEYSSWNHYWDNLWLGTSVSTQAEADERIPELLQVDCKHRWLSVEPILGDINLEQSFSKLYTGGGVKSIMRGNTLMPKIDWLVVGGESGPGARPAKVEWFKHISDQCKAAGVPYYFKGWGKIIDKEANIKAIEYGLEYLTRRETPKEAGE
jgi:protein gp37